MVLETIFLIIINIVILISILKIIQNYVSKLAKTSIDRYHNIYQGGELLNAKNRRYQTNLYILIIIFLILHILAFLLMTLAFVDIKNIALGILIFMFIFVYILLMIRKGVNYS